MTAARVLMLNVYEVLVEHAVDFARRGWHVFPCRPQDKRPYTKNGLKDATSDVAEVRRLWQQFPHAMIGVRAGAASGFWAIDPDVPDEEGKPDGREAWSTLTAKHGPIYTHTHLTPRGGQHLLLRWDAERPVTNSPGLLKGSGIDVRGEGGYIIAPPSRRADGKAYEIAKVIDFFRIVEAPQWLYDLVLPPEQPKLQSSISERAVAPIYPRLTGASAYAAAALRSECDRVIAARTNRNDALNVAALKLGQLVGAGHLAEGEVVAALLQAAAACGYIASDGERAARATIDSGLKAGIAQPRQIPERHPKQQLEHREGGNRPSWLEDCLTDDKGQVLANHANSAILQATPFAWRDPANIPRREWLYGRHLIRQFGSATIAHPGVGKSALMLCEALALATGRDLLGVRPWQRCRVWYWNGEDPLEETERRIAAACLHYGIPPAELDGWLFTDSGREQEIILAKQTRDGAVIAEPVSEALVKAITANKIDVLQIDPFISSHRATENDNNAIDVVAKRWTKIAEMANCAIDLAHHSKKTSGVEVTVEDGRGASALLAAVRSARALNKMSADEAVKLGIPEETHNLYFRADNGKANLAPPDKAAWFHITSVSLGNGDPTNLLDTGDNVGVVTAWERPDPFADLTVQDFDRVAAVIRGGRWRENPQAKDWAGHAVAQAMQVDSTDKTGRARAAQLLRYWLTAGSLRVVEGLDAKRNPRKFIEVSDALDDE